VEADDGILWQRSGAGDLEAFGSLFERHGTAIYNYLFRRTGNWTVAEDLLSIVFLEAWRRRSSEVASDKVLPWLYGIATNVIRSRHRAERRYAAALHRLPRPESTSDFTDDSDARLDAEQRMRALLDQLAQLPKRDQDVLILCGWSGLSYEEAAFALDVPVGTVRSRLARARVRMRELTSADRTQEGCNPAHTRSQPKT
jgi:RNA polymerase sigma-70 factor (ECF subfamily)